MTRKTVKSFRQGTERMLRIASSDYPIDKAASSATPVVALSRTISRPKSVVKDMQLTRKNRFLADSCF